MFYYQMNFEKLNMDLIMALVVKLKPALFMIIYQLIIFTNQYKTATSI